MNYKRWLIGSELYTDEEWKHPWVRFICWFNTVNMAAMLIVAVYYYIFKVWP